MQIEKRKYDNEADKGISQEYSRNWWNSSQSTMHNDIFGVVRNIKERQSYRSVANLRYARLYKNRELIGLQSQNYAKTNNVKNLVTNRVTLNVVRSAIDTATAQIAKNKVRPYFLTEEGNWEQQRKAQNLTQFMDGQLDEMGL